MCKQLNATVADRIDLLQFAYRARRGVEDASVTLLDLIPCHLDRLNLLENAANLFFTY
jgi:hypothetical protein